MLEFHMAGYPLHYLPSGHVFIDSTDDCDRVVDALLETGYDEEFCLALDFGEAFISRLMEAGFLVMSTELKEPEREKSEAEILSEPDFPEPFYLLLPKLHRVRSILVLPELHVKKSVRPFISLYELQVNTNFDHILDKCVQIHGDDWLTSPLVEILKSIRKNETLYQNNKGPKPVSFAVYREGELKAGEVGVVMGRVYTSYSGYYEEDNAGMVQMILMAQWLEKTGFNILDFGMPLDYKTRLGARDITPSRFVELFRSARY
jgi:Leu/Phe-tRNA-protein transferase